MKSTDTLLDADPDDAAWVHCGACGRRQSRHERWPVCAYCGHNNGDPG